MILEKLSNYTLILASQSPRRQQFLKDLGLNFEVRTKDISEDYPFYLKGYKIPLHIAKEKATPFLKELKEKDILITADTLIWFEERAQRLCGCFCYLKCFFWEDTSGNLCCLPYSSGKTMFFL